MNTVEQSPVDLNQDQSAEQLEGQPDFKEHRISGFDGGNRSVLKEPSLYLSILIVLIATSVCLSKTPTVFWISLVSMTGVAIALHVLAERLLFRAKKEFDTFTAPLEGIFVITLGSILPGIGLLAYAAYSLSLAQSPNFLEEIGKLALLLVVPLFNWTVWKAVRKGYLIRPRLVGLMNGLALGLSASWTTIWLRSVFFPHADVSCKFGWMLLLFTSPFLLFAAACLSRDLCNKTEPNISRIAKTFSVLGGLLALLFVFAPMARTLYVQSLLVNVKQGSIAEQAKTFPLIRSLATDEDLRPAKNPVSGFALASLFIPNRGLDSNADADKNLYFKITGNSYSEAKADDDSQSNGVVGAKLPGLSLAKSQISGVIDASTLSSSLDWTFTLHNSDWRGDQEARSEISLPKGAVVSRAMLWINGEPRDGRFAATAKARQAYEAVVSQRRDPLLVTMPKPDRLLVQCFPVPPNGGEMKIRLGFKVPLETSTGKTCSLELPKLLTANFSQPKRHRISLVTKDMPVQNIVGMTTKKIGDSYSLTGIIKTVDGHMPIEPVIVQRSAPFNEFATPDYYSGGKRFIVERLKEMTTSAPKHLLVVIDSSASLTSDAGPISQALSIIPTGLKPAVYFAEQPSSEDSSETEISAKTLEQAQALLKPDMFTGGNDNRPALREALETAAEKPDSAVLWIHGAQPMSQDSPTTTFLDLVHGVRLYDWQIESGPNSALQALRAEDVSNLMTCESVPHKSIASDMKSLVSGWEHATKTLSVVRTLSTSRPETTIVADESASAQVTALWANEEFTRLTEKGRERQALVLAANYHIVTPLTAAVVLENRKDYPSNLAKPDNATRKTAELVGATSDGSLSGSSLVGAPSDGTSVSGGGLVGAPVDPRYGQSNEVGQMADYGYDTARDISRLLTVLSLIISLIVAATFLRHSKSITSAVLIKSAVLVVAIPATVHVMGTFMINNFGGLGGGL